VFSSERPLVRRRLSAFRTTDGPQLAEAV